MYSNYLKACARMGDLNRVNHAPEVCQRRPNGREGVMRVKALAVGGSTEEVLREARIVLSDPTQEKVSVYREVVGHFTITKGTVEGLEDVLKEMKQTGVQMDIYTFDLFVRPQILARNYRIVLRTFQVLRKEGLLVGDTGVNWLFALFGHSGFSGIVELYQQEFGNAGITPPREVFEAMINFYHVRRDNAAVMRLFNEAVASNTEVTIASFIHAFNACAGITPEDLPRLRQYITKRPWMLSTFGYNCMLEVYSSKLMLKETLELFTDLQASSFGPNATTYNIVINHFGRARQLDAMVALFRTMQEHNVPADAHTYAHLIFWHSVARSVSGACELLTEALAKGYEISASTFGAFVDACMDQGDEETCNKLVEEMVARGQANTAYHALLTRCTKEGDTSKILRVYGEMEKRGVGVTPAMYEVLLRDVQNRGEPGKCQQMLEELEKNGVRMSAQAYSDVLRYFARTDFHACAPLLAKLREWRIEPDLQVYDEILYTYVKYDKLDDCRKMFALMRAADVLPNTASFNIVLGAAGKIGDLAFCDSLLAEMRSAGPFPNEATYNTLLLNCSRLRDNARMTRLLEIMKLDGFPHSGVVFSILIYHAGKSDDVQTALRLFAEMKSKHMKPTPIIFHDLLFPLLRMDEHDSIISVYDEMRREGFIPKTTLYSALLRHFAARKDLEGCKRIMDDMKSAGLPPDFELDNIYQRALRESTLGKEEKGMEGNMRRNGHRQRGREKDAPSRLGIAQNGVKLEGEHRRNGDAHVHVVEATSSEEVREGNVFISEASESSTNASISSKEPEEQDVVKFFKLCAT